MSTPVFVHKIKMRRFFAVFVTGDRNLSVRSRLSLAPAPLYITRSTVMRCSAIKIENTIAYTAFIWYNNLTII